MSKKFKLFIALIAVVTALFVFCSCDNGQETPGGETTTVGEADTTGSDVIETPAELLLVNNGEVNYKIIRPDSAAGTSTVVECARNIRDAIKDVTGATATLGNDYMKDPTQHDATTLEILVGFTNYSQTEQVYDSIGYGDYAVRAVGNKIVIAGYSDNCLKQATDAFIKVIKDQKYISEDKSTITIPSGEISCQDTTNDRLSQIPLYDNALYDAYYKAGNETDELIIKNATIDTYNEYIEKMSANGWTLYTTNEVQGNKFATHTNSQYTINSGYYKYENRVRIIIEDLADPVGLASDNVYTPVTTSQITMIGLEYLSGGSYKSNGQSVLIRLTDGRFVVIDGGFNYASCATELLNQMKEQSKDYVTSTKDITVAAWIITHSHGDHSGMIANSNVFSQITVEKFLVNFLSYEEHIKSYTYHEAINDAQTAWGSSEKSGDAVLNRAAALGATVQIVHVGQIFYLADLEIEVLYTIESFGPGIATAFNTLSLIMKMTFNKGTENETVYMSTGDATGDGFDITAKMYGSYLKSDIVQVAHHGYTTWGNSGGTISAYTYMAPPTLLWPQGMNAYPNYKSKDYNVALTNNKNYVETLVAGSLGDITIFPIPYTPGSAIVTKK